MQKSFPLTACYLFLLQSFVELCFFCLTYVSLHTIHAVTAKGIEAEQLSSNSLGATSCLLPLEQACLAEAGAVNGGRRRQDAYCGARLGWG